jgi:hypothetical protein
MGKQEWAIQRQRQHWFPLGNLVCLFKSKKDYFNVVIINLSNLHSNMPTDLAYGVNIIQLIR